MKNKKKSSATDINVVIKRVRRSTRKGQKGLLLICDGDDDKEYRAWYKMY